VNAKEGLLAVTRWLKLCPLDGAMSKALSEKGGAGLLKMLCTVSQNFVSYYLYRVSVSSHAEKLQNN
jgi:hypothetical protein